MPIIFEQNDASSGEEESLMSLDGQGSQEVDGEQLPPDKHVDWWVQQDRALFFGFQMGLGH